MIPDPAPADASLLSRVAAQDPAAVRALLDSTGPVVYGYLYARVGGDESVAEDLLQETYLEAMRSAANYRGEATLTTWLCAIARRRLARHYEAERRRSLARSGLVAVGAEALDEAAERRDEVIRALGRLPSLHRQVLVMKYLDDYSVEEVAAEVGRTRTQVQSLLQRAREGLRRLLEESQ